LPWSRAHDPLSTGALGDHASFLGTVRPDGHPHAARVGAIWFDGDIYFTSSPQSRKARNLAANANCTISVSLDGIDLSVEGRATRVTDNALLEKIAGAYSEHGWPAEVAGDALTAPYSAPSAGPAPWYLYQFRLHTVFGGATAEPYGATRWRFSA
jgi:pyridoxamine 5'-phosphate oxidase-like protein